MENTTWQNGKENVVKSNIVTIKINELRLDNEKYIF